MQAQIGRVGDTDNQIGHALIRMAARHDIARDRLVRTCRGETVGAGQIEHAHAAARGRGVMAFLAFDRHASVVRDFLARAGQEIE